MSDAFKSALNVLVVEDDKELAGFVREGLEDEAASSKSATTAAPACGRQNYMHSTSSFWM